MTDDEARAFRMDEGERTKHMQHEQSAARARERAAARERVQAGERPWDHEQGALSVVDAVRDLEFPLAADDIAELAGERFVQPTDRLTVPVAEVVAHLPRREYLSIRDFEATLLQHWQGIRFMEVPEDQRPRG